VYAGVLSLELLVRIWCSTPVEFKLESTKFRRLKALMFLALAFKLLLDGCSKTLCNRGSQDIDAHLGFWSSRTSFL
jgi:hypothetical protein